MSEPTNKQLAEWLETDARSLESCGFSDGAERVRNAAQRLEGKISEAKVKAAAAGLLKSDYTVFSLLTPSELEESARAAVEAAREA